MTWDLSCPDWAARLRSGRSLVREDLPIDREQGDRAVAVFNKLRLADVPGTPTMAEAGGDWFRDIVRALFGSMDPVTRARAIRELFLLVPKKNSKTTNGALLMLTALLLNERPNGSMIMTAPVQDVAQLAFEAAAGAIALDNVLHRKLHVREHLKTIVHRETKTALEIMTFEPEVLTGQKPIAALIDELHVVAKKAKAASAIRQLRGGMLPFPEAFMAFITTQAEEPPAGVFKAELTKARDIRDGKQQGAMLPVLYEFPREMQEDGHSWRDPRNWWMVTPNAGRSITIGRLEEDMRTAEQTSEEELRAWASQHLDIEIGLALQSNAWAGALFWEENAEPKLTLESILNRCEVVSVGIDGGGLDDMLGLSAIGREKGTGLWLHWAHAWIHPIVLERRKKEAPRFHDFAKDGDLTIVEKIGDDLTQVAERIQQIEDAGLLERVGVDVAGIGGVVDALVSPKPKGIGLAQERIVGIPQGWKMVGAIKTTERKLAENMLKHAGSNLMAWCVGNAKVEPRGNAIVITKQLAGSAKIDPLMATYNAVTLMALNPEPRQKKYDVLWI
jgi:phage terminase large subunit-like protein